ncbi:Unconventional myosin-Va [Trichinella spiralis]|uniref:Unconventional myosin-Va n=1 Tax=Trichinella spiralis TaxID=6334 RepID=A0ABR3K4E7_TRISP
MDQVILSAQYATGKLVRDLVMEFPSRDAIELYGGQRCFSCAVVKKHQYVQGKRILQSLLEVANLLVGRKTGGDIPRCNKICSSTKVSQIVNVLRHYSVVRDYELKVSAIFICNSRKYCWL